jgi:peptidoglycan-associated lipoprotein
MRAKLLLIAFLGLALLPCAGQTAPDMTGSKLFGRPELGLNFTEKWAKITNTTGVYFNMPGGALDVAVPLSDKRNRWAIAADVQGEAATKAVSLGYGLDQISYVAGLRFTYWRERSETRPRANLYAQAMAGGVHAWDSIFYHGTFSAPASPTPSANSWAFQAGTGLNLPLKNRIGWRVMEFDYIATGLPNADDNFQGDARFETGLTFRF